ncbi:hypothetical protein [Actinoplanes sp. M2I2]|uniref:hypothetical protein n=1 Tax=Actinoplanes sp. M2I2 TaxID=1734444 RepID=UPI002020F271|nr:hypothetical protein [Actinoplanes sp. M2I2]
MLLADCALWATQDHRHGALLTSEHAAGLVIAAAALADLITADALAVTATRAAVLSPPCGEQVPVPVGFTGGRAPAVTIPGDLRPWFTAARWPGSLRPAVDDAGTWQQWPGVDPLGAQILHQILQDPELGPGEVIEGLAAGIRHRVTDRLIRTGAARAHTVRGLWWRRSVTVAVAPHRQQWIVLPPLANIYNRRPLTHGQRFWAHLITASSLGPLVLGHLPPATVTHAIGDPADLHPAYQPLLNTAVTLLHHMALAR